jgi:signal peptidase II
MTFFNLQNNSRNKIDESILKSAFVFWFLSALVLILAEQLLKYAIVAQFNFALKWGEVGIENFNNYDFAFSLPVPQTLIYTIYFVLLSLMFVYLYKRFRSFEFFVRAGWLLIAAGALSNIGERLVLGYVRDYIYIFSGIFNLADFYIFAGIIMLLAQDIKFNK